MILIPSDQWFDSLSVGDGCWVHANKLNNGYQRVTINGKQHLSHRVMYEFLVGPIPDGLTLDHLCRNRGCVNPKHLEPVSHRVNVLRGVGVTAKYAVRTHCAVGHEFTEENIYLRPDGGRKCRECGNNYERQKYLDAAARDGRSVRQYRRKERRAC